MMQHLADYFFQGLHIPPSVQRYFLRQVEDEFGKDIWLRISPHHNVPALGHVPALLVHDKRDFDVPVGEGAYLHSLWPGSEFMQTDGLGHRRILRHPSVIETVVAFIKKARPE